MVRKLFFESRNAQEERVDRLQTGKIVGDGLKEADLLNGSEDGKALINIDRIAQGVGIAIFDKSEIGEKQSDIGNAGAFSECKRFTIVFERALRVHDMFDLGEDLSRSRGEELSG